MRYSEADKTKKESHTRRAICNQWVLQVLRIIHSLLSPVSISSRVCVCEREYVFESVSQ